MLVLLKYENFKLVIYRNIELTPRLDIYSEARNFEFERVYPNFMCLDGHGIGVSKLGSFPEPRPPYWPESHPL